MLLAAVVLMLVLLPLVAFVYLPWRERPTPARTGEATGQSPSAPFTTGSDVEE